MVDKTLRIAWANMKDRCYNKNNPEYNLYGLRGIFVCEEWKLAFKLFKEWAINNGHSDSLSLDRIDNNKGYSPDNCRWTNRTVQKLNCNKYKNNKTGHKGIHISKGKYRAMIRFKGVPIHLGYFVDINDAIEAREKAEKYYLNEALMMDKTAV